MDDGALLWVEAVVVAAGAVLFFTGAAKVAAPRRLRDTVRQLGLRTPAAGRLAAAVGPLEMLAAAAVTVWRGWPAALLLVTLGTSFAAAGVWAAVSGRDVACHCFGRAHAESLGLRQLVYLPVWVAVAVLAMTPAARAPTLEPRLAAGTAALALAAVATVRHLVPRFLALRAGRLHAEAAR